MSWHKTFREVAMGLMLLILALIVWVYRSSLISALMPFLLAIVLAYLLNPLVDFLQERRLPRVVAILLLYLALGLVIAVTVSYTVPRVVAELDKLTERLPEFSEIIASFLIDLQDRFQRSSLPPVFQGIVEQNIAKGQQRLLLVLDNSLDLLLHGFGRMFIMLLTPILTFYILKDMKLIKKTIAQILPGKYRRRLLSWLSRIDATLGSWIRGQILIAMAVGALTALGLKIIGLDFAVLLGVVAGILDIVPYFGPFIGGIPPVVVGLFISPTMALKALIVIVIVQQIESNLITPQVLGHSLGLHPLIVIFSLLLGGEIAGFWGLVIAVPVAAMIKVTLEHLAASE